MNTEKTTSLIIAVLCLFASAAVFAEDAGSKPNIVLIIADDLGYGDVGFNGNKTVPTPALDKLAESGVNFTAGYVTHPYCGPSRAGLITGRWQQRFGGVINPPFAPAQEDIGYSTEETTLASYLKKAGYKTGMIGKWHLGVADPYHPLNRGFDYFFGMRGGGRDYFPAQYPPPNKVWNQKSKYYHYRLPIQRNLELLEGPEGYLTDIFSDEAIEFINRNKDEPFFLYLSYNAPHTPLQAKEEDIARFSQIEDNDKRVYSAMVYSLSEGIGRVIDALEAAGLRDDTMVFFISDNGGKKPWADNGPLRGGKGDPFEGGFRVPFVLSWPGKVEAGKTFEGMVSALDIAATAMAAAGAEPDAGRPLDGVDLMPYLAGEKSGVPHDTVYVRRFYGGDPDDEVWAVRHGDWKLVKPRRHDNALFNLAENIGEKGNSIRQNEKKAAELQSIYNEWKSMHQPPPWGWEEGAKFDARDVDKEAARRAF